MTDNEKIVFIDCETTSLRPDRRAWEIAAIVRRPGAGDDEEYAWFIEVEELDLGNADPTALKVGRFYERHPQMLDPRNTVSYEWSVLKQIERLTRGAILMGSNPSFDAETLARRMRKLGLCPSWHYHPFDVPTLALGWLYGSGVYQGSRKSDAISAACGIDPAKYDRHTALGDCRWMRDLYDQVTGARP